MSNSCEQPSTKPYKNLPSPFMEVCWAILSPADRLSGWVISLHPSLPPTVHSCLYCFSNTPHSFLPQGLLLLFPPPRLFLPISHKVCFSVKPLLVSGLSDQSQSSLDPIPCILHHSIPSVWHFIHLHAAEHYLNSLVIYYSYYVSVRQALPYSLLYSQCTTIIPGP